MGVKDVRGGHAYKNQRQRATSRVEAGGDHIKTLFECGRKRIGGMCPGSESAVRCLLERGGVRDEEKLVGVKKGLGIGKGRASAGNASASDYGWDEGKKKSRQKRA